MNSNLNRREFLKIMALLGMAGATPIRFGRPSGQAANPEAPNVLVILFDALTAMNMSLHGYPRKTMPKLERLANRAVVYHNHYSGGGYTTPATASLLTGTLPWTHRAFNPHATVSREYEERNIFSLFGAQNYFRVAYTHNILADVFLKQFRGSLEERIPRQDLYLNDYWVSDLFDEDYDTASLAVLRSIEENQDGVTSSLFWPRIYDQVFKKQREQVTELLGKRFPHGLPDVKGNLFTLEKGIDWIDQQAGNWPQPFLGYFHFLPPHDPYKTRRDFFNNFLKDDWEPVEKPEHPFTMGENRNKNLRERAKYDEFISYVDFEFNRLFRLLRQAGILDNTWLVFTSDHGEMFERGIWGHNHITFLQPRVRIPLLIFPPGGTEKIDVHETTSAIDVLPTLLHFTGQSVPDWTEGLVLPPYNSAEEFKTRRVFNIEAKENAKFAPFTQGTVMIIRGPHKLIKYFGYPNQPNNQPYYELYDVQNDPEELVNLYDAGEAKSQELTRELDVKLDEVNQPYF